MNFYMRGYTLIEILIVLFIISIVTSVALLSISRNENKQLESFANELTQKVTLAEEQAMLQPHVLGLSLRGNSYQFASYEAEAGEEKNVWTPQEDAILGKHKIPSDIEISVQMGGVRTAALEDEVEDEVDEAEKMNPQIVISTNGDITPFIIYVGKKGEKPRYAITGDADGSVTNKLLS